MHKKNITVPKTARYFVIGEPGEHITSVWFVCHGYGQAANFFIKHFEVLANPTTLIIAPEGLHRFYWEKFSGRVVASWMTKEDREDDIKDYVNYMELVYQEVLESLSKEVRIHVLGFSQGTSTVCRWIALTQPRLHDLVLWAGSLPPEIDFSAAIFNSFKIYFLAGDEDEFVKKEQVDEIQQFFLSKQQASEIIRYKGKHGIDEATLMQLAEKITILKLKA
jgi:predicted esterase